MDRLVVGGYELDLPLDFGIQLTYEIADIRDPEKRGSAWSKTFTLPGTKTNRKAFSHLYELDASIRNTTTTNFSPDFNPNLKAAASYYHKEVLQVSGFMRLIDINIIDNDSIEFNCSLHGVLSDLFSKIKDLKLADIDLSEFNHTLTASRITESWTTQIQKNGSNYVNFSGGNPTGEGYVYGLIDNGSWANYYGNTHVSQFFPQVYAKQIIDKIFEAAGFEYTTDSFFNETIFKRLTIPCATGMRLTESDFVGTSFEATSNSQTISYGHSRPQLLFGTEVADPLNEYTPGTSTFTQSKSGYRQIFKLDCDIDITGLTNNANYVLLLQIKKNGAWYPRTFQFHGRANGSGVLEFNGTATFWDVEVNAGDTITFHVWDLYYVDPSGNYTSANTLYDVTFNTGCVLYNLLNQVSWGNNGVVNFQSFFDEVTTQEEFIKSIMILFNLYAEPDPDFPEKIYIQSRDNFYNQTVRDWSGKLDISQPLVTIPMGELDANPYYFSYAKGEDEENKTYEASYNRIYGDYRHTVTNDFIRSEKKIEVVFAPSQLNKDANFDKVLTFIPQKDSGVGQMRILYFGGAIACDNYLIFDETSMSGSSTSATTYPSTLHIDHPTSPTFDLNFGMPMRVNLPHGYLYPNSNLFNNYWQLYIDEISNKDSKIVVGDFYLTPADIEKLSFRDLFYFENNYFRLNKISDYDPTIAKTTKCEFLKLNAGTPYTPENGNIGYDAGDLRGNGFPGDGLKIGAQNSTYNKDALVVGRDNGFSGKEGLIVGDTITMQPKTRLVSVVGSTNIAVGAGVERATVINSNDIEVVDSDVLIVQGKKVDIASPTDGDTIIYDNATGTWINQAAGGGTFESLTDAFSFAGNALKVVRVNAGETALEPITLAGGGDMLAANNLSDLANASTARSNLGVAIGVNVQAYDADLTDIASQWTPASAGVPAKLDFHEDASNGGGKVELKAPSAIVVSTILTLPAEQNATLVSDYGACTFTNDISVPDEAYGAGWNASMEVPTKNAIYDKFEAIMPYVVRTYTQTTQTIADDSFIVQAKRWKMTSTDRLTIAGTGHLTIIN